MKKVLFAASEAVPFIKTGGLADVAGTLPANFPKNQYDVRVILPLYACMDPARKKNMKRILECQVSLNWRTQYAGVYQTQAAGVTYYLIDNEYYFSGPSPYDAIYLDAEKFAYFSKAVLTVLPLIGFQPDIIHCHDWQTGLLPVFLREQFAGDPFYRKVKTVFTIHNLRYQGRWFIDAIRDITGLADHCFTYDRLESYGKANLLKGGIVYADAVTTVSISYCKEICTPEGGEGLDGALRARGSSLQGILNGLDYEVYHPGKDPLIAYPYTSSFSAYKASNKAVLQERMGLKQDPDTFLIGIVSRLTDQKGMDLIACRIDYVLQSEERIQLVVLGTGEERYEHMFQELAARYPGRAAAQIAYQEDAAHQIYAGCDAFLMPSMFEPCGLTQMMSLRYGTVPIVRETGGLKDTVEPYNEYENTGTGFSFSHYNAHEMSDIIAYAAKVFFQNHSAWEQIAVRGMQKDFSWKHSAGIYQKLYESLIPPAAPRGRRAVAQSKSAKNRKKGKTGKSRSGSRAKK
jgi:starch synthase